MSIYNDNMGRLSPGFSSDELAAKIARGKKSRSFHGVRKMSAIAAAAAAAMALTVTAGAISGWDFDEAVRSLFSVESAEGVSDRYAEITVSDYVNEFEDAEFNFIGAASDDIFTMVFLEVTRTDGGVFNSFPVESGFYGGYKGRLAGNDIIGMDSIPGYDYNHSGLSYHCDYPLLMDDGNNNDGKLTYAFVYDTATLKNYANSDESVTLKYDFYGVGARTFENIDVFKDNISKWDPEWDIDSEKVQFDGVKGYMSALVTVPFGSDFNVKKVYPEVPIMMNLHGSRNISEYKSEYTKQKEFTLTSISVSTASVSFSAESIINAEDGDSRFIWTRDDDFITLNMKDGTSFSVGNSDLNKLHNATYGNVSWRIRYDCMLGRIIDPEDVASVTINGQTFELE